MHPSQEELIRFIEGGVNESSAAKVGKHIEQCDFCREFVENYRLFLNSLAEASREVMPPRAVALADRLYFQALQGKTLCLIPLITEDMKTPLPLAADSDSKFIPHVQHLATLCSESPEIVLRVMRDLTREEDYLQLICDDPALSANVMVQIPELDMELITDNDGRATIEKGSLDEPQKFTWQIKMPDAVFSLQPLVYDPDKTEYAKDLVLETERRDKIKVTFEGKTEGKQISIRILELDGKSDFSRVKVSVSQQNVSVFKDIQRNELLSFDLIDANDEISIRLFQ